jgi:hypothetical protein
MIEPAFMVLSRPEPAELFAIWKATVQVVRATKLYLNIKLLTTQSHSFSTNSPVALVVLGNAVIALTVKVADDT